MINQWNNNVLIFDGAMGTLIQNSRPNYNKLPELLNIEAPELITSLHQKYIEAGADVITTNTFGANAYKLKGSGYSVKEVVQAAVKNARAANSKSIALDIGPIGKAMAPVGDLTVDEAYELFKEQVICAKNSVDLILIETMASLLEAKTAILAAKENSDLPIFVTMTLDENDRTLMGNDLRTIALTLSALNVDAIGLNCSFGPKGLLEPIKTIISHTDLPVMIQPNAGLPKLIDDLTIYNYPSETFKEDIVEMINLGVSIIGGCCGTTPEFISKISQLKKMQPTKIKRIEGSFVTSNSKTLNLKDGPLIIGERINPTGKTLLKEAIKNDDFDYIYREALDQLAAGADILDVNLGIPGINEKEKYKKIIPGLQMITDAPLQIDTSDFEALETALRVYEGRPIINSVSGKDKELHKILPLAKKYGALIIGLTLDEKGLPKGVNERIRIGEKIISTAKSYEIKEEDILLDCITLSISTNPQDAKDTLDAVEYFSKNSKVTTTLGASNISFGLPNRNLINTTFLSMALTKGLDAPITDPTVREINDLFNAYYALTMKDIDCSNYIDKYKDQDLIVSKLDRGESNNTLIESIINGLKEPTINTTKKLLDELSPMTIVDDYLIKALNIVGDQYDNKEIFLPQLIRSASCVQEAFRLIKLNLDGKGSVSKGKVLLATVEGDIHDIGKNIVKVLLENYGFQVIDLGKDVPKEIILEKIIQEDIQLVGLSALMTTTVRNMKETIKLINTSRPNCKIFVGGAVLTEEYAKEINANHYCKDAQASVRVTQNFFKNID